MDWLSHLMDLQLLLKEAQKNSFLFEALSEICCRGLTSLLSRPHSCVNNAGQWAILKSQYNGLGYKSLNILNDTYRTTDTPVSNMNTQILIHKQVWVQFCEYFWLTNQQIWFIRVICSLIGQHSCSCDYHCALEKYLIIQYLFRMGAQNFPYGQIIVAFLYFIYMLFYM